MHERLEVRLVDCGNFRLREHRRRRDEAVESRTAAATGFIEKVGGVGGSGLYSAISRFARRLRRINAETQRFAEERRERRKKMLFSSALLCALCVSALKLVGVRLRLGRAARSVVAPLLFSSRDAICPWALFRF